MQKKTSFLKKEDKFYHNKQEIYLYFSDFKIPWENHSFLVICLKLKIKSLNYNLYLKIKESQKIRRFLRKKKVHG